MNSSRVKFNTSKELASAFNFGPALEANQSVQVLIEATLSHWPGNWQDLSDPTAPHEAGRLHLQIDKAHHQLGWRPRWPWPGIGPCIKGQALWSAVAGSGGLQQVADTAPAESC